MHDAAAEVARGTARRALPDRRLPDRLGHVEQHERQRGHRDPRHRDSSGATSIPTTTSTPRSRPTTSSRTAIHIAATRAVVRDLVPALRHLEAVAVAQGGRVRDRGEVRPHPPDGRDAGDARAGVRRLRRAGRARHRAGRGDAAAGRRAAPRRHGGRHRHQHAAGLRGRRDRAAGRRHGPAAAPRRATTSRRRARATAWSSCPASCARSPCR